MAKHKRRCRSRKGSREKASAPNPARQLQTAIREERHAREAPERATAALRKAIAAATKTKDYSSDLTAAAIFLTARDAFFTDHQRCGDLDAGLDRPVVWLACDCGASMARGTDEDGRTSRE